VHAEKYGQRHNTNSLTKKIIGKKQTIDMTDLPRDTAPAPTFWHGIYDKPLIPWDIGSAQPELVNAIGRGDVVGPNVLDVGCGTGDNSILLARSGFNVTAFDLVEKAVVTARERVAQAGEIPGTVELYAANVFELDKTPIAERKFDTVLDSAILHCIGDDDTQKRYVDTIAKYVRKGGRFLLHVFSDQNPDPWVGPRRISESHARTFFNEENGWKVESVRTCLYMDNMSRPKGGGEAIFMVAERIWD
jgi:2-polyprenyl-3-methyl-5-hydroxy-6-metoxy-1,4-benzoquinol methylase